MRLIELIQGQGAPSDGTSSATRSSSPLRRARVERPTRPQRTGGAFLFWYQERAYYYYWLGT